MKIKTLAIVVLSALSLSSAAALADTTTVNGGTVHFKGEVVNAACAVDAGSVDQTVQLGQVRTASLKQAGATSSAVGFNIQLNDCDTTVATKAAVAFLGTAIDATHTDVLALQSSAAGSATNVGVQILDRTGAALALDGATFREVAIKWSAAPDMTPQTVLYRRPVAQFSNFQPKIVSSWLILALFQANFLISGRSRLCPYQLVNSNQVRQGE